MQPAIAREDLARVEAAPSRPDCSLARRPGDDQHPGHYVQRSREEARALHSLRAHREGLPEGEIEVAPFAPVVGKAGRQQRAVDGVALTWIGGALSRVPRPRAATNSSRLSASNTTASSSRPHRS
jgi:hypothetical protein